MWWVLVLIMVMAYLVFGMFLAKKFYVAASGSTELDDVADVALLGFLAVVFPATSPFIAVVYGLGKLGCKLSGLTIKKKEKFK